MRKKITIFICAAMATAMVSLGGCGFQFHIGSSSSSSTSRSQAQEQQWDDDMNETTTSQVNKKDGTKGVKVMGEKMGVKTSQSINNEV